jgi:hypothetical protein
LTLKANPDDNGVYHIEKGVVPALDLVYSVQAEFPKDASKRRLSGATRISFVVDTEAHVHDAHVVRSAAERYKTSRTAGPLLRLTQLRSRQWNAYRFKPALFKGTPVPVEMKVEVEVEFNMY